MGDRLIIEIKCAACGDTQDVYYAPTCDFTTHTCSNCGNVIDIEQVTGISAESLSSKDAIDVLVDAIIGGQYENID